MRAEERFRTDQPGITTWHCFSAGSHYDPDNVGFGSLIGLDEHLVEPGAGFDWHRHRGVQIASWVLEGTLRHEGERGDVEFVTPGALFVQSTGTGVRHTETNPSDTAMLRFLQLTVLDDNHFAHRRAKLPARVGDVAIDVRRSPVGSPSTFTLVLRGRYADGGMGDFGTGDSFLVVGPEHRRFDADADAQALVVELA